MLFHHELLVRLNKLLSACTVSGENQSDQVNQKANGYIGMRNARVFLSRHYGLASATFRRISPKASIQQS